MTATIVTLHLFLSAVVPGHRAGDGGGGDRNLLLLPGSQVLEDHGVLQEPRPAGQCCWARVSS